ncbi:MAG: arsenic resistance protein, partial [Marinobacter sp.]
MKDVLERYQVWLYLATIILGMMTGWIWPAVADAFDVLLWPALGILLYATFTQVPLTRLATAIRDRQFNAAMVTGNFIIMPAFVWLLLFLAPADPAMRLGIALVLLVPCTDWFISFTHLGGGDSSRAIAATPVLLLLQILTLPVYLWLFLGEEVASANLTAHLVPVFFGLIITPLVLAWLTEKTVEKRPALAGYIHYLGWLPVPALAMVVFLIAASQIALVLETGRMLPHLLLIFSGY